MCRPPGGWVVERNTANRRMLKEVAEALKSWCRNVGGGGVAVRCGAVESFARWVAAVACARLHVA